MPQRAAPPTRRRGFLRNPYVPKSTKIKLSVLSAVLVALAVGLPTVGIISNELGQHRSTYTCTVQSVILSPLRDGEAAWDVNTDCGGAIDIDPPAAGQTAREGRTLAAELRPGQRYRLTVKGVLHTPLNFSVELLSAVQAASTRR